MSWRFARRFAITRLVRLNVSKRGASVSVGPRGATATINQHGVRGTVGLPGTGLSASKYVNFGERDDAATRHHQFVARVGALIEGQSELTKAQAARVLLWQEHYRIADDDLGAGVAAQHQAWRTDPEIQQALSDLRIVERMEADATTPAAVAPSPGSRGIVWGLWMLLGILAFVTLVMAWVQSVLK